MLTTWHLSEHDIVAIFIDGKWFAENEIVIQRCQWHKRENVVSYLDKENQATFRRKLQAAYGLPTYEKAKARLEAIKRELSVINICDENRPRRPVAAHLENKQKKISKLASAS